MGDMAQVKYLRDEAMNFETVALTGGEFGDDFSIQRALRFDAEDVELGTATYSLSRGIGPVFYGGVESWSVGGDAFSVTLSPAAADSLAAPPSMTFPVSAADAATLAEVLPRLLK